MAALLALGGIAHADPIVPNVRPVTIGAPTAGEPSLDSILGCLFLAGYSACDPMTTSLSYSASGNQTGTGLWGTFGGSSSATLNFEYTGSADAVGIWSAENTAGPVQKLTIFNPSATGANNGSPTFAGIQFVGNVINVFGPCGAVNCQWGLTGSNINPNAFGFFITHGLETFYTMDALNPGGYAQALSFTNGVGEWAVAFENSTLTNTPDHLGDYNDEVLTLQSVVPAVPEPGSVMLVASGLAVLVRRRRRSAII